MDFMNLLKSVEELLYEVVSWLLFYPLTFWRCIRHPLRMMSYASTELAGDPESRFAEALSPPIFIFLTLGLAHLVELRFAMPTRELTGVLADGRNLLLFRAVLFSLFPLLFAIQSVRLQDLTVTRDTLRAPFYSHCYVAAPFVLFFDLAVTLGRYGFKGAAGWSYAIFAIGLAWYVAVLVRWLFAHTVVGTAGAVLRVTGTLGAGALIIVALTLAMALASGNM